MITLTIQSGLPDKNDDAHDEAVAVGATVGVAGNQNTMGIS